MDKTELEKAAINNNPYIENYDLEANKHYAFNEGFEAGAKWRDSLPSPSVEEIRERFELACTWMDGDEEKTIYDHKKVFEFFLPYINGDVIEFTRFFSLFCETRSDGYNYNDNEQVVSYNTLEDIYTGPYQEYLKTKNTTIPGND